jgi:hypothetical protein
MCGATFSNGTHEVIFELDGKEVMCLTPCWRTIKNNQRVVMLRAAIVGLSSFARKIPPSGGIWNFLRKFRAPRET